MSLRNDSFREPWKTRQDMEDQKKTSELSVGGNVNQNPQMRAKPFRKVYLTPREVMHRSALQYLHKHDLHARGIRRKPYLWPHHIWRTRGISLATISHYLSLATITKVSLDKKKKQQLMKRKHEGGSTVLYSGIQWHRKHCTGRWKTEFQ